MTLTRLQQELIHLVARERRGLVHDDVRLQRYCDPVAPLDVFNECHNRGWLRSTHDVDTSISIVRVTDEGLHALANSG